MREFWRSRSASERRLALIAGGLGAVFLVYLIAIPAFRDLAELDRQIEQREQDLITDTELAARSEIVDREFASIASEHSSKWTKQEIHDRLRQEIDRLAQQGLNGGNGPLVQIPVIPPGKLVEGGGDFREYQLTFRLAPTSIDAVTEYLKRIHESPQALRIDGMEMTRAPETGQITVQLDVTRTVVSGEADTSIAKAAGPASATSQSNLVRNGSFEQPARGPNPVDEWDVAGGTASPSKDFATEGASSLAVTAAESGGSLSQLQELEGGATYEVRMDILVENGSGVRVGAADASGKAVFDGSVALSPDKVARGYVFRFTVPGDTGATVALRAPYIELPQDGQATFFMDNVQLRKVSE